MKDALPYIIVLMIALLIFRYVLKARILSFKTNQFIRDRMQCELRQDIGNIFQSRDRILGLIESNIAKTYIPVKFDSLSIQEQMESNISFIDNLEAILSELSLIRDFKYKLYVDPCLLNARIDLNTKMHTFRKLHSQTLVFDRKIVNNINVNFIENQISLLFYHKFGESKTVIVN